MSPRVVGDGFVMSSNVGSTEQQSVQSIVQVGGVRAFRLMRDLGITSVYEVARSSPAELMQITSVGPVRAKEIFADANQTVDEWKEDNPVSKEHRVAVIAGQDVFDEVSDDIPKRKVLEDALDKSGIPMDENTRLGFVTNDEMGGDEISTWLSMKQSMGSPVMRKLFETPWSKYSRILDPIRHVEDSWLEANNISSADELPKGRMPERPSLDDIPFDVARYDQIQWWMAPAERTSRMVSWADEVVILIDGEYADSMRRTCEYHNVDCTTVFELSNGLPLSWSPAKEPDHFVPDEDEAVRGEGGVREGSVPDLASDDEFRDGPNDVSDDRVENDPNDLTKADAGGTGVGSRMGRWG